jgi:hypothetical protein
MVRPAHVLKGTLTLAPAAEATTIGLAAMLHIKDQGHDLVVANFVQDPPITGTHSPGPRIPDKLCGPSWPGIVRKPVNHASHLLADYAVKPIECLTRLVAEDDFINPLATGQLPP